MRDDKLLEKVEIREITASDEALISEFFDAMGGESRALFNRRDYNRRGVLKYCQKPDSARRYYIATLDGRMAGYVFFLDYDTSVPTLGVAVRDDLRGLHLGRQLVVFAQEMALSDGKGGIILTTHTANLRAQSLYETMGFVCMGLCKNGTELLYLYRYREKANS